MSPAKQLLEKLLESYILDSLRDLGGTFKVKEKHG